MGRRLVAVNTKICRTLILSNALETLTRLTDCYEFDDNIYIYSLHVRKYAPDSCAVYCSLFHWPIISKQISTDLSVHTFSRTDTWRLCLWLKYKDWATLWRLRWTSSLTTYGLSRPNCCHPLPLILRDFLHQCVPPLRPIFTHIESYTQFLLLSSHQVAYYFVDFLTLFFNDSNCCCWILW